MHPEFCSSCLLCGSKQKARAFSGSRYKWPPTSLHYVPDVHDVHPNILLNAVQQQ